MQGKFPSPVPELPVHDLVKALDYYERCLGFHRDWGRAGGGKTNCTRSGANGARILSSPESKPWHLHEFTAEDIDGNLIRVFHDFAWELPDRGGRED